EVLDASVQFDNEKEITILDETFSRPSSSASVRSGDTFSRPPSVINCYPARPPSANSIDRLPRLPPPAKERRVEPNTVPSEEVKAAYKNYYRTRTDKPVWCNYFPFEIAKVSKLSNYQDRRCVHCKKPLGVSKDNIVIIHNELYTFNVAQSNLVRQATGLRSICPENPCMFARYPYITEACFFTKLSEAEAQRHIEEIFIS
uniref:Uncharacterized protein n=1 Tax=Panagrolaimus sp. ES5 TaxID=591445 RepID=A0AC34FNS3_9BILA